MNDVETEGKYFMVFFDINHKKWTHIGTRQTFKVDIVDSFEYPAGPSLLSMLIALIAHYIRLIPKYQTYLTRDIVSFSGEHDTQDNSIWVSSKTWQKYSHFSNYLSQKK